MCSPYIIKMKISITHCPYNLPNMRFCFFIQNFKILGTQRMSFFSYHLG